MNKIFPFKFPIFRRPYQKIYFMPLIFMVHRPPFFCEVCLLKKPRFPWLEYWMEYSLQEKLGEGRKKITGGVYILQIIKRRILTHFGFGEHDIEI